MPPNSSATTGVLYEPETKLLEDSPAMDKDIGLQNTSKDYELKWVWRNIILFAVLHISAVYGVWLFFTEASWRTHLFFLVTQAIGIFGISGGAHRLWSHRAFKANLPLQLILLFCNTFAFQDSVYVWVRDHRVHHKYTETDADPYNAKRGWFFAHIGWLCCKKHPDVVAKGKEIDLSDLKRDPLIMFQHKYYLYLMPIISFVLPTAIPMYFWGESLNCSWHVMSMFRWCLTMNIIWMVNSSAHKFGMKPYDKNIGPTNENVLIWMRLGEGYHNYHHTFPWDYKASELGPYSWELITWLIDCFAKLGWAYDLKSASEDLIRQRVQRTGDGSHPLWGWGDKDQLMEDIVGTTISN
ncbi:desaturase F-epsilon [Drosophila ananassae]|uniref:Desaturase F-epsilon n=1 Tax=Drosophila ananassae TaxID=7217 RepID=B3M2T6_DROAN|nr:acyl-CoA Delta-9 desaturase [Drosophila ananassae]EDV43466.1 desaturase F-epsilon [Drosophila ananassae]